MIFIDSTHTGEWQLDSWLKLRNLSGLKAAKIRTSHHPSHTGMVADNPGDIVVR
jgi:hypothetical protein